MRASLSTPKPRWPWKPSSKDVKTDRTSCWPVRSRLAEGIKAPDYVAIARQTAADIGYVDHAIGMDATSEERCEVTQLITSQSAHINRGVVQSIDDQGAGDQGLMFGYACNETEAYPEHKGRWMPLAIALAQALTRRVSNAGSDGTLPWARPDAKSQVTLMHGSDGQPSHVDNVVIAVQHRDMIEEFGSEEAEQAWIREQVLDHVIKPVLPDSLMTDDTTVFVNSTGRFVDPGGPYADAGLTGRKIIVDTYGGRDDTAAVPSRARTRRRWTGRRPTPLAGQPNTSWPPVCRLNAKSNSPTPSAGPTR